MSRSILIKGLEVLVIESYAAARKYGVEEAMIATRQETFPGIDRHKQGAYFFSRAGQRGKRGRSVAGLCRSVVETAIARDDRRTWAINFPTFVTEAFSVETLLADAM